MDFAFKKVFLLPVLSACATFVGVAQTLSPLPMQVTYGAEEAFPNSAKFRLAGAEEADSDAVNALVAASLVTDDPAARRLTIGEAGDKAVRRYKGLIPQHEQAYYLKVTPEEVVIAGRDGEGTFYGVQTFLQLMADTRVPECEISDWPSVSCRGVIEGFYGNPWSHEDRLRQMDFYGSLKMNMYVYGPKDDPYHRARWREPYPPEEARRLGELAEAARRNKVQFVWAVHPGGDIRWNREDSLAIVEKLEQIYRLGVRSFAVFFDDIGGEGARAEKQAALLNYVTDAFVRRHKGVRPLLLCPTEYNKSWAGEAYLPTLGEQLYPEVRIMWTGNSVVDMIESDDLEWVNPLIRRKAFIWLNYPVNDYCQSRLLMGKTYGNGLDISDMVSGFCSNPMEYAEASKVSLFSIAEYTWNMEAYDAEASWRRAMDWLMPTAREAFSFFCANNVDMGRTGHGLRREGESREFASLGDNVERRQFFRKMLASSAELLADSVNHPQMVEELAPWVRSMALLAQRGLLVCRMGDDLDAADTLAFTGHYRALQAAWREQQAIVSRDFEGSIVRARPVVSGDVVTPWVSETADSLVAEYRRRHTYGLELFPVRSIEEGEYLITVGGSYLTNPPDSLGKPVAAPVFMAERDVVNPQRQQWLVEADPTTGRYKISSKQDGSWLDERGTLCPPGGGKPFDPARHTFTLTRREGSYSIQCAGKGGEAYLTAVNGGLGQTPVEQTIFVLEPLR